MAEAYSILSNPNAKWIKAAPGEQPHLNFFMEDSRRCSVLSPKVNELEKLEREFKKIWNRRVQENENLNVDINFLTSFENKKWVLH